MKTAVDSSALAKRYVFEPGSESLEALLRMTSELGLSVLVLPEIVSALQRRLREGYLSSESYRDIKKQLVADVRDATVLQLTDKVVSRSVSLLERNVLRALDALHVACALEWGAELFVTADKRQAAAAARAGLRVQFLGPSTSSKS